MSESETESRYGRIANLFPLPRIAGRRFTAIGVGSMGHPVVNQLVRHGVATTPPGRLRLIDGDVVRMRNLIGTDFRTAHVGVSKACAAASLVQEINPDVNVSYWEHTVTEKDIPRIEEMAHRSDLLGLFADDFSTMLAISDRCFSICPQVMAIFGPQADFAEVAFSIPGVTPPLSQILGRRGRKAIDSPSALGCDTVYVSSFVAAVCLRLLLGEGQGSQLLSCYANAPLFAVGLRKAWIFAGQPADVLRTIVCVETPSP